MQEVNVLVIFGLPIVTKSTITLKAIIVITNKLHHIVAHTILLHLIYLMSTSHRLEVEGHC